MKEENLIYQRLMLLNKSFGEIETQIEEIMKQMKGKEQNETAINIIDGARRDALLIKDNLIRVKQKIHVE